MTKYIILVVLAFMCLQSYSQRKPNIKGNRNVVEVREDLPAFTSIELIDNLEIFIESAPSNGYSISADDNLIDILKFNVEGDKLTISSFYNVTAKKKLEITIYQNELTAITVHDGKIESKNLLTADQLEVNLLGYAKMELNAKASLLHLKMEGNSSGDFNLESDSLNISLKDKVDARMYIIGQSHSIEMENSASASLEGTTEALHVQLSGTSKLKAERMEASAVNATLMDSSSGWLFATQEIDLSLMGSTHTYLYGDGKITISEFLDTAELHKRKN